MTRKAIQKHKALTRLPSSETDYEVGYGKPPKSSRFKKGKSGNPKGRPKGAKNRLPNLNEERLKSIIIKEAYRPINVVEDGRHAGRRRQCCQGATQSASVIYEPSCDNRSRR